MTPTPFTSLASSIPAAADLGPLFAVRQDAGPFLSLGSRFSCNKARWIGKVVASPVALYLVKKAKNRHSHGGGIAGALLASALGSDDGLVTCTVADLPQPIREEVDHKGKLAGKPVVIIPLTTVSFIQSSRIRSTLKVTAGADHFKISMGFFKLSSLPGKLAALGWTLNTPLTPIDAPIHDTRTAEERLHPPKKPLWMRVLLATGAVLLILGYILPILGYILLRIFGDFH